MFGQSEQMLDKLNQNKTNLADQRLLTITFIAFFGFMKFSEVSKFRRSDLVFSSTYVKAFIEKIKANIIGKECGFISQFFSKICPLKQFKYYVAFSKISENSEEFIFRSLSRGKNFDSHTKQINK